MAVLIATSGEAGKSTVLAPSLAAQREAEARAAAVVLGLSEPHFLRLADGSLAEADVLTGKCREFINVHQPDLVLTFDPHRPWSSEPHPDHLAMGRAGIRVAQTNLWLYSTSEPEFAVDITQSFQRKLAAREAHRSQTSDVAQLRMDWRRRSEDTGRRFGAPLAEAFRRGVL